jgi:hypothetical protein
MNRVYTVGCGYVHSSEDIKVKLNFLGIFFLALFTACGTPPTDTVDNIEQDYLFEVEYVNHAWGLAWTGLVVDRSGDIYAYDHGHAIWEPSRADAFTKTELDNKYEHSSRYIGRIDQATIAQQFSRISSVGDHFLNPQQACADAGSITYRAFSYEPTTSEYRPLLLREEGDIPQKNISNAAEELASWLRSLVMTLEDVGVTPFADGVCTP